MKTVVSNSQVAHLWANQNQEHARSDSMSFRGPNLYSYSTCIAALHASGGTSVALINSRKFSTTTSSKHMPQVRNALRGLPVTVIDVPEVFNSWDRTQDDHFPSLSARAHSINQSYLCMQYQDYAASLMRKQSLRDWHRTELSERAAASLSYARLFNLGLPAHRVDDDWGMAYGRQLRLASDPKRQARIAARERAAAAKAAAMAVERVKRQAEYLAGFRAGNAGQYWGLTDVDGAAYLRLSTDGQTVQTSRGASVPTADAIRAIRLIYTVRAKEREWKRNGEQCPVGQFQIDRISADGDIHAGCHFIKWTEIAAIATALGMGPLGSKIS